MDVNWIQIMAFVFALASLVGFIKVMMVKKRQPVGGFPKWVAMVFVGAVFLSSMYATGLLGYLSSDLASPFAAGVQPRAQVYQPGVPTVTTPVVQPTVAPVVARKVPISTVSVVAHEKYSNKWDQVGNDTIGYVKIYPPDQNPSNPSAQYIDRINVTSGAGSSTLKRVLTDTDYRVVFDGGGATAAEGWYDEDFGVMQFRYADFIPDTGDYTFRIEDIARIATIDDVLNETGIAGDINGQTSTTTGTDELGGAGSDLLTYDVSVGDESFYIQPKISISGGNREVRRFAMCFDWEEGVAPEGNEYTALVYQHIDGTDFNIPSDLLNYWANEECLLLADTIRGGTSGKIKLTFSTTDGNIDANDDWAIRFDDLDSYEGKDITLNKGATHDSIDFEHQA